MPKIQPKRILFVTIALCISLLAAKLFPDGISLAETSQQPSQGASEEAMTLLSASFLSPVPEREESVFPQIHALLPTEPAVATASGVKDEQDFCMDIPVILYHHVQPLSVAKLLGHELLTVDSGIFDEQMRYLKEQGYTAISADELVNALRAEQQLPAKTIVITLDDGYDDNYTYAFLVAKKYELIMNFMIPTALINKPGYMTWDHLREMQGNTYARIYNHTATHAPLGLLKREQIEDELASSSAAFQEELGADVHIFTYPYGSYNDLAKAVLQEKGFQAAFTTLEGTQQCKSKLLELQRSHIGNASLSFYGL